MYSSPCNWICNAPLASCDQLTLTLERRGFHIQNWSSNISNDNPRRQYMCSINSRAFTLIHKPSQAGTSLLPPLSLSLFLSLEQQSLRKASPFFPGPITVSVLLSLDCPFFSLWEWSLSSYGCKFKGLTLDLPRAMSFCLCRSHWSLVFYFWLVALVIM